MPKFTTSDRLSLHYEDTGTGLPILCLSGLTRNCRDFDYVAPHLSGHRLIRMDYRGRGQSDYADDYFTYSIPTEARDALELMDHLELDRVAIIGTSRGGLIAMMLGATAHDRLLGVALNDIGPELDMSGIGAIMEYLGRRPAWKTYGEAIEKRPAAMTGFANIPRARWEAEVKSIFIETPDGLDITYDPRLRDAMLESSAQPAPDLWPLFYNLADLPLVVIRGANSNLLSRETVLSMKNHAPDLIMAEVADRGHIPFLDEPESLAALQKWIGDMT